MAKRVKRGMLWELPSKSVIAKEYDGCLMIAERISGGWDEARFLTVEDCEFLGMTEVLEDYDDATPGQRAERAYGQAEREVGRDANVFWDVFAARLGIGTEDE